MLGLPDVPVPAKVSVVDNGVVKRTARIMVTSGPEARLSEFFSPSLRARLELPDAFVVTYVDPEGDSITVSSDEELQEALILVNQKRVPLLDLIVTIPTTPTVDDSKQQSSEYEMVYRVTPEHSCTSAASSTDSLHSSSSSACSSTATQQDGLHAISGHPAYRVVQALEAANAPQDVITRLSDAICNMEGPAMELDQALSAAMRVMASSQSMLNSASHVPSTAKGTSSSSARGTGDSAKNGKNALRDCGAAERCECDRLREELKREREKTRTMSLKLKTIAHEMSAT